MNKKKVVACVIARTTSSRLPLKVLRNVYDDVSLLDFIIKRLKKVKRIDEIFICTSDEHVDDILEDVAEVNQVSIFRGDPEAVIDRMLKVGNQTGADILIRITGDNVFTSYEYLDSQTSILIENDLDYARIVGVPLGATAEVIKKEALEICYNSIDPVVSEYLMLFIFDPEKYKCGIMRVIEDDLSDYTLTVDTAEDLLRTKEILKRYLIVNKDAESIKLNEIMKIIRKHDISNAIYQPQSMVKLPYNKQCSFEEFKKDMNQRIQNSLQFPQLK